MTILQLGNITFSNLEIPASVNFGGKQMLDVNKQLGGIRTINALGPDDDDITWSGLFLGVTASYRARYLDTTRAAGQELILSYANFLYRVVIKEFKSSFTKNGFKLPYSIRLSVIENLTQKITVAVPDSFPAQLDVAMIELLELSVEINNPSLSGALAIISGLLNQVGGNFDTATQTEIATVLGAVNAAQNVTSTAIAAISGIT